MDTSEKLKNSDIFLQLRTLSTEINSRWDEVKQFTLSVTSLRAMLKNQSEGFGVMKQVIAANFSSSSTLSDSVVTLAGAVAGVCLRVDEQVASAKALKFTAKGASVRAE